MFALTLYILLLLSPNLAFIPHSISQTNQHWLPTAANLLFVLLLLAIHPRLIVGILLLTPAAIIAVFELLYVLKYERPSDAHLFGILAETTSEEFYGYLGGLILPVGVLFLCTLVGVAVLICMAVRQNWRWSSNPRRIALVGGILGFAIFALPEWLVRVDTENPFDPDTLLMGEDASLTSTQLELSYPLGIPFRVSIYQSYRQGLYDARRSIEEFRFGATQASQSDRREVYVLVIGETGRPDRWSINGYARYTNPKLSTRQGLISLTNVISPWAWTRMSVPVILTRKPENDARAFFAEKSLIAAFREAGYQTYWLSTQSPLGTHDSSISFHAHEAHHVRFFNPINYKGAGEYDGVMLAPVKEILSKAEPRQLIVLHTLGSHFNYAHRFPSEFDVFQPSHKTHPSASLHDPSQKLELNNAYDNSILYTDFLLDSLIELLEGVGGISAMHYVADHGENLFDGECKKSGHGHATDYDFRVASVWWSSQDYMERYPDKVSLLEERRHKPLSTGHVFHTLLDAANIRFDGEDATRSLLSQTWIPRPRWTQTGFFFDSAERETTCKTLIRDPSRY